MKLKLVGMLILVGAAATACKVTTIDDSLGGSGGTGSTTSSTKASSSSKATVTSTGTQSTSTGGDPCADGSDCTACQDFNTCATCEQGNHPTGANTYNNLVECVFCTGCYTVCDGASAGCPSAPPTMDACDSATPDPNGPGCQDQTTGCIQCAEGGTCMSAVTACQNDTDCVAFAQALQACPQN